MIGRRMESPSSPVLCLRAQALEAAESQRWALEGQKARVEAEQLRHLAWSGHALVGNSLGLMEEAVDHIRAAFLLPQKELKCAPASTPASSPLCDVTFHRCAFVHMPSVTQNVQRV